MRTIILTILTFFYASLLFGQTSVEQIAFDYFFKNIFDNEYKNVTKRIKFSGKTETSTSGALHKPDCLENDLYLWLSQNGYKDYSENFELTDQYTSRISKSKVSTRKNKYHLRVYSKIHTNSKTIVLITMTRKHNSISSYYFIFDSDNKITDWCKISALI